MLHQSKIDVWFDLEDLEHLIEHLAMLRRSHNRLSKDRRAPVKLANHRRHFYDLGPRADDGYDFVREHLQLSANLGVAHCFVMGHDVFSRAGLFDRAAIYQNYAPAMSSNGDEA